MAVVNVVNAYSETETVQRGKHFALVVQRIERHFPKVNVGGSSPSGGTVVKTSVRRSKPLHDAEMGFSVESAEIGSICFSNVASLLKRFSSPHHRQTWCGHIALRSPLNEAP